MNPWGVLLGLIVVAVVFVIVPVAAAAASYWRRPWLVRCPRARVEARIGVDAADAAVTEVFGRQRRPDVARCSLWRTSPSLRFCARECLALPAEARRPAPRGWRRRPGVHTILVPLDGRPGSEAVLPTAAELARAQQARLRLLRVARPPQTVRASDDRIVAFIDQETSRIEEQERGYLARVAARLEGVYVETVVRFGDSASQIVEEAERSEADLIALATHHRRGVARAVRGSVAARVARAAPVPVVLVPYEEPAVV